MPTSTLEMGRNDRNDYVAEGALPLMSGMYR